MPGSKTTPGLAGARNDAPASVAFRGVNNVGTRVYNAFAAQWLVYTLPYRRFAVILAEDCARIGGRRGLLLLHRSGLSPHTPCRSPGALTHVAACTLAQSPYFVIAIRRLQTFRYLHDCSGCCRRERIAGWASHPLESAALSRP